MEPGNGSRLRRDRGPAERALIRVPGRLGPGARSLPSPIRLHEQLRPAYATAPAPRLMMGPMGPVAFPDRLSRRSASPGRADIGQAVVAPEPRSRRLRVVEGNPAPRRFRRSGWRPRATAAAIVGVRVGLPGGATGTAEHHRQEHDRQDERQVHQPQDVDSADVRPPRHVVRVPRDPSAMVELIWSAPSASGVPARARRTHPDPALDLRPVA